MSEFEPHENELSSASSRSTESLEENIRKILTVVESKGHVLLDNDEMSEAVQQLAVEGRHVGEFLAQIHSQNHHSLPDRMATTEQHTSTTKRSNSCPEDLAKKCSNTQQSDDKNAKSKRNSDKGPSRETWELDSGTHDLGNYEPALQQLMSAANAKGQSRSSNFLELANTLHLAALASLKNEIVEVSGKLRQVTEERDALKNNGSFTNEDRKELIRDYEERLLAQSQQSEEQITELQSVIAELDKKLQTQTAKKIDELDEVESQTSEHGSRSSSLESIESNENEDDVDDELSKVVGELEFAIERQKPQPKDNKKDKEPIKVTVKVTDDKNITTAEASKASLGRQEQQQECNQLTDKARQLREQCIELEKKKQVLERQLQQASLREYVARKKSSSFGSEGGLQDSPCNECAGLRTKLNRTTFELESARKEIDGFKDERDKLRRRILEMQEHLKALHQKTISYETASRGRSSSFHEPPGSRSPMQQRAGSRSFPRPSNYSSAASDVSSRDGHLAASPRIIRRSSTENLNASMTSRSPSTPRRAVTLPGNYGRRSSGGSTGPLWNPESPTMTPRGSVQSIASTNQMVWKGAGTSDLGSSHGSTQEITVMARPVDEGMESRMSGEQCIRSLSQLPEFASGRLPNELLRSLRGCRNLQDVYKVLFGYCDDQADKKLKEYELEIERLKCTVDHLQSQINVISLSLEESRENAEKMCVLMGKYESNNTVSQLSLSFCDKVIEAYEVLLQLSESEQSCLYANCKAAGIKSDFFISLNSSYRFTDDTVAKEQQLNDVEACLERRRTAESEARSLLQKLDRDTDGHAVKDQPWESVSSRSRTSSGSSNENVEFTREEESRLKSYIQQLKSERSTVGSTVLELEGIHDIPEPQVEPPDPKLDLENAVLMQELMALKEEKAELKARNYLIEKEKKALELKINSRDAQEQAYLVQIEQLKSEIKEEYRKRRRLEREKESGNKDGNVSGNLSSSGSGSGNLSDIRISDDDLPTDLQEAAIREKKLRIRIKELMEALESLSKNSETRHTQTAEYVSDLKRANGALVAAYEKAKKKHAARLRKLEQQMISVVERHDAQVKTLKEKISFLEEKDVVGRQNETAL